MQTADTSVPERLAPAAPNTKGSLVVALARRAFLDARTRTVAFTYIFAVYAWLQAAGYKSAYPTLADRIGFGMISTSVSTAGISKNMQKELAKFGTGSITTHTGYLSFVFIIFIFAACMFMCAQVSAARQEEAEQQLETLLALPVSRYRWLGGRLLLAIGAAGVLAGLSGLLIWAGADSQGLNVSLAKLLEAGANCMPAAILFLGIAALAYATVPRASAAIAYTLVTASFLWYLVGSVLDLPRWLINATPFQHIGLVPAQSFRVSDAVIMAAIGLAAAAVALGLFRRRDLLGA